MSNTNQVNSSAEKRSNVEFIYGYTEALIKSQEESLNRLDTKLSAFLAFAGVSLRFAIDLPGKSELTHALAEISSSSLLLKLAACGFCVASILVSGLGLTAKAGGRVVDPEILMDDKWYWEEDARCRAFVINTWIEVSKDYKKVGLRKGATLNLSIGLICAAAIAFSLNAILLIFCG